LKFGLDAVHAAGGVAEGCICYTGDISNPQRSSVVRTLAATGRPPCAMPGRPWADAAHVRRRQYTLDYYMEMADALVEHGVHTLAIKDMAGLLKPRAATTLLTALRERFPDVPLHVHTHDTAGTGVATQLACAAAGADIVDCCIDAMSGALPAAPAGARDMCAVGARRRAPAPLAQARRASRRWARWSTRWPARRWTRASTRAAWPSSAPSGAPLAGLAPMRTRRAAPCLPCAARMTWRRPAQCARLSVARTCTQPALG